MTEPTATPLFTSDRLANAAGAKCVEMQGNARHRQAVPGPPASPFAGSTRTRRGVAFAGPGHSVWGMRNRIPVHCVLIGAALLLGALPTPARPAPPDPAPAPTQPATRPAPDRDPWVFRCVLDDNPRMLIISLGDGWWMAFDTVHCSIYKLWHGEIELTGAVYDTKHGPQPKAKGTFVINGRPPLKLDVYPHTRHWTPTTKPHNRQPIGPVRWRGYELKDGRVTLKWDAGAYQLALTPTNQSDHVDFTLTVSRSAEGAPNDGAETELPTIFLEDDFKEVVWPPVLNFADESIVRRRPTFQIDLTPGPSNTKEPAQ